MRAISDASRPVGDPGGQVVERLLVGAAALLAHVERMIRVFEYAQRGAAAELLDDGLEQREIGERVARALKEQERHVDLREMLRARDARLPGRMEREAEER